MPDQPAPSQPVIQAADPNEEACRILVRLESPESRAKDLLDELNRGPRAQSGEGPPTARWVLGVLRHRGRLDQLLAVVSHRPIEALSPWVRETLRLSLYLALHESVSAEAVVEGASRVSKRHGHDGAVKFVAGCLRELCRMLAEEKLPPLPRHPVLKLSVESSHPFWMAERLVADFGYERAAQVLAATDEAAPLTLRCNLARHSRDQYLERLRGQGLAVEACAFSPWGLRLGPGTDVRRIPGFYEGDLHIQDESAQLIALLLDPQPGWRVADLCAAPGGKAGHLAQLVGPQGRVFAFDRKPGALEKLQATLGRQGYQNLECATRDAINPDPALADSLDAVVLDAPSSALGVLRRRPEARWQARADAGEGHAPRQLRMLQAAARSLKAGGILLYTTTSWDRVEDEAVVEHFLDTVPGFAFERAQGRVPIELCTREGYLRGWPGQESMDGVFAARLRKVA